MFGVKGEDINLYGLSEFREYRHGMSTGITIIGVI